LQDLQLDVLTVNEIQQPKMEYVLPKLLAAG
jgi:hypothetical protein